MLSFTTEKKKEFLEIKERKLKKSLERDFSLEPANVLKSVSKVEEAVNNLVNLVKTVRTPIRSNSRKISFLQILIFMFLVFFFLIVVDIAKNVKSSLDIPPSGKPA
jgi:hypothetical protein